MVKVLTVSYLDHFLLVKALSSYIQDYYNVNIISYYSYVYCIICTGDEKMHHLHNNNYYYNRFNKTTFN